MHVIDVLPTVLEAAGVAQPATVNGVAQQTMDGKSFLSTLASAAAPEYRTTQYFEMHGNVSIYHNGWIAAQRTALLPWGYTLSADSPAPAWELYNLSNDYAEAKDLARAYPDRLAELKKLFQLEGERNKVFPIDPRVNGRQHPNPPPPGGRAFYTFYPGARLLYDALAPGTRNRTHTFTAYVDIPAGGSDGVIVAEGGASSGYSLYIKNGRPAYTYNYFRREVTTIAAKEPLRAGKSVIELRFEYDGGGAGKGAKVSLLVNGKVIDEARLARTVPRAYAFEETFDVGEDTASPVGPYDSPFVFAGTLERLELRSGPAQL